MSRKKPLILVVDDEPDLREIIKDELEFNGFDVMVAENGTAGWQLFQAEKIDAVVSDIRMPGGGGLQLLEKIRSKAPRVPVILVTGFADIDTAGANQKGATRLFSKPIDLNEVVRALKQSFG